jgi:hypothetical protein
MRIRRNSNPYEGFTLEQRIMGDKAEDLGFVWDRTKYPTPAWAMPLIVNYQGSNRDTTPQFGIPLIRWDSELALWACDCAERALPIWRNYYIQRGDTVDPTLNALEIARGYIQGIFHKKMVNDKELTTWRTYYNRVTIHGANTSFSDALYSVHQACRASKTLFADKERHTSSALSSGAAMLSARYAVGAIARADGQFSPSTYEIEEAWQKAALASRIDAIAPWSLP